jgi:hypothetical protein
MKAKIIHPKTRQPLDGGSLVDLMFGKALLSMSRALALGWCQHRVLLDGCFSCRPSPALQFSLPTQRRDGSLKPGALALLRHARTSEMSPRTRPHVIADSDDEDFSGYSPPASPPAKLPVEPHIPARSFYHQSHETSSTDPAFFQSVYDEQSYAAQEQASKVKGGHLTQDRTNSGMNTGAWEQAFCQLLVGWFHLRTSYDASPG